MFADSAFEPLEAFSTFDDDGQTHEVEVWATVTYSVGKSGQRVRSVGLKHLRMAGSGSVVHSHLDGTLEDSNTGRRLRVGRVDRLERAP